MITNKYEIANEGYRIPIDGGYTSQFINGMSVLVPDLQKNSEALQQYIYGEIVNDQYKDVTKQAKKEATEDEIEKNLTYAEGNNALRASGVISSNGTVSSEETKKAESTEETVTETPTPTTAPTVTPDNGNGNTDNSGGQEITVAPTSTPEPTPTAVVMPTTEPEPTEPVTPETVTPETEETANLAH